MFEIARDEAAREAANRASEREFVKLVKKLISLHSRLATIGENDMGLSIRNARRFHTVTRKLHDLVHDLTHFTDAIIEALDVTIPEESSDSPSDQADICLEAISELKATVNDAHRAIKTEWGAAWDRLDAVEDDDIEGTSYTIASLRTLKRLADAAGVNGLTRVDEFEGFAS